MEQTIERVSKFGIMVNGEWLNWDKKSGLTSEGFHAGDVVALTKNPAGFVTAAEVLTAGAKKGPGHASTGTTGTADRSSQIARGAAVKAVLESPYVYDNVKDRSDDEFLAYTFKISDAVAHYIEHGNKA